MTRNYDKICALLEAQMDGLAHAVDTQDLENFIWISRKIEGMLNSAKILLTACEWSMIYNKYCR